VLRQIDIQAVDFFRPGILGFVKFRAHVSTDGGETLPGSVFLRGGSVGILVGRVLNPDGSGGKGGEKRKERGEKKKMMLVCFFFLLQELIS
jgi:hypothetical protein